MKKQAPNLITTLRIALSVAMLFAASLPAAFFTLYTICGISDILDGFIARRFKLESKLGALLDSIADIVFMVAVIVSLRHILYLVLTEFTFVLPSIIVIFTVKIAAYTVGAVKFKRFTPLHTILNKATGALLFLLPYFFTFGFNSAAKIPLIIVLVIAGVSALEDLILMLKSKEYTPNKKSLFERKKS